MGFVIYGLVLWDFSLKLGFVNTVGICQIWVGFVTYLVKEDMTMGQSYEATTIYEQWEVRLG